MAHKSALKQVDQTGFKVGAALTILLLALAFVLNSWLLVAIVALCQLAGALGLPFAPYRLAYQRIIRPAGLAQPRVIADNPEPHHFAMLLGSIFNGVGAALLASGSGAGWIPVFIVLALANLQFWLDFCLGCWMYYQLHRLGVPGFKAAPVEDAR